MAVMLSMAALIVFHSSANSRTFALVAKESAVSTSAKWFAPLVTFAGLSTGLLLSSNSSELSHMIANTWCWWLILLLKL
jgi:hypothetical protein